MNPNETQVTITFSVLWDLDKTPDPNETQELDGTQLFHYWDDNKGI